MRFIWSLSTLLGLAWPAAAEPAWQAQWIGVPGVDRRPNTWIAFRKEVSLERRPQRALARIACDSKYWLWINGQLVVFEGQLKRGPTPNDTYHDVVDLAPYLREGDNTVAALVWYWGKHGYSHRSSWGAGFLFDADLDGQPLPSDHTWRARLHPAYGSTGEPNPNPALPEHNVQFDARRDLPGWEQPGYEDDGWPAASEFGPPPTAPWNALYPRPVPLWKDYGLRDYVNASQLPAVSDGDEIMAQLPYNAQITPYLRIDAPAGLEIRIQTDNYTGGGPPNVRAVYITREGVQEYESLGWMNGHNVRYSIPPGVRILALRYRETGYDADFVGQFLSDDLDVNTLRRKAERTLYVNMRDSHADADRERAQWWGDVVNQLGQVLYVFDAARGPRLVRKGIYELVRWRRDDHVLYSPIPQGWGYGESELPMQSLASVGWYGFWTYYWYTGDRQTLLDAYPAVRDYLRLWRLDENGLVVHRSGDWDWPDWYDHADVAVLENAWYYLALKAAVEMARLGGHEQDAAEFTDRMRTIATAFDRSFWRGDRYRSAGHAGRTDDRGNAMAVVAGLARPEYHRAIRKVLQQEEHASPYMEKYVLEALYLMDAPEEAIARMKRRWASQIASPLTTLWESWTLDPAWNTYDHAWSGGALTLLGQYAAGVAPTAPGFASYAVLPRMGPLRTIDAAVPTSQGTIRLALRRQEHRLDVTLTSPPGTLAIVGIPRTLFDLQQIRVDRDVLWRARGPTNAPSAVRVAGEDEHWIRLSVPPGHWVIEASNSLNPALVDGASFALSQNPIRSHRVVFHFRKRPDFAGVFTIGGARVVDLLPRIPESGVADWDLTNDRGARVAAGVYLLVARIDRELVRQKLFILRPRG